MVFDLPNIGSVAKVKKGGSVLAKCQGVTVGMDAVLVKEYEIGSADPAMIKIGHKTYPIHIDRLFTDYALVNDLIGGLTFALDVHPSGTAAGEPSITYSLCRINTWELGFDADGPVLESCDGEAESIATGTVAA